MDLHRSTVNLALAAVFGLVVVLSGCADSGEASGDSSDATTTEVERTVRSFLLGFDEHDGEAFVGGLTEQMCANGFGEPCESLKSHSADIFTGQPAVDVRSLDVPVIDGEAASVDLVTRVQTGLHHTHLDLVLSDGVWLVDSLELDASAPVALPAGVPVIDVSVTEFAFDLDTEQLSSGIFALRVRNDGELQHELVIKRVDDNAELFGADDVMAIPVASMSAIDPGSTSNVVLADQLPPGHYFIFCEVADGEGGTHLDHGMATEFTVAGDL